MQRGHVMTVRLHQTVVSSVAQQANGRISEKKHVPITAQSPSALAKALALALRARQALVIAHRQTRPPLTRHRVAEVMTHPPAHRRVAPRARPVLEIVVVSRHSRRTVDPASYRDSTQA